MPIRDLPTYNKFTFPTFEVITPHTGKSFLVRSLTVAQESVLKESAVSASKALSMVNQTLFDCLEDKQAPYNTLEGFEKNLSMVDRTALIYGLIVATYGEKQQFNLTCQDCGKDFETEADITSDVKIDLYNGKEDLINKDLEVVLPVSKYTAVLKIPTLYDEKSFSLTKGVSKDILNKIDDYLIVKKLLIPSTTIAPDETKVNTIVTVDNLVDIYSTIVNLPARDRKAIYKEWFKVFGEYGVNVKVKAKCPECGKVSLYDVNVVGELFRQLQ